MSNPFRYFNSSPEVIRAYQDDSSGVVASYGDFVAKFMGDGILA